MIATLKLYAQVASRAVPRALRGWPAALPLLVYPYVLILLSGMVAPLGLAGGLIMGVISALLISSYLYLLAQAVEGTRFRLQDLGPSFTAHFSAVIRVGFIFWIGTFIVAAMTRAMPSNKQTTLFMLIGILTAVFFNPLPEVIYQRRVSSYFGHLVEAARFITEHWPSWLLPNVLLAVVALGPVGFVAAPAGQRLILLQAVFSGMGPILILSRVPLWLLPIMLLFIHWAMVFRGLLFQELSSGVSARQRAIRDAWRR